MAGCNGVEKLKAVAVREPALVDVAHPDKIAAINKRIREIIKDPFLQSFGPRHRSICRGCGFKRRLAGKKLGGVGLIDYGEEGAGS